MRGSRRRARHLPLSIQLLALGMALGGVRAGEVAPMTVRELADFAGQVIIGRVTAVRSYWAENPRRIESTVTFDNVAYLKGAVASSSTSFALTVPGGEVGTWEMRVGCAPTFAVGEKWLLFLLPTYRTFPTVGLSQGAFRVVADSAGVDRVYTAVGLPLAGIDERTWVRPLQTPAISPKERCVSADRVRLQTPSARDVIAPSLPLAEFLDQVRPILAASRTHHLIGPAGQRETVHYTPVPFPSAPAASRPPKTEGAPAASFARPSHRSPPLPVKRNHRHGIDGG